MNLTRLSAVLVALLVWLAASPASPTAAHADYASSTPGRGEQLAVAPPEVEITFTQQIQKITGTYDIAVNKDRGLSATSGPAVVNDADRTKMSVPLQPNLGSGRYVVNWKNLSDGDGDPKEGAFSFYLNYVPTAVDLANDAELEQIGNEGEEPVAGATDVAETPVGATPEPSVAVNTPSSEASPAGTPASENGADDSDSGSNAMIIVAVVIIVAGAAAGGALLYVRRRSNS